MPTGSVRQANAWPWFQFPAPHSNLGQKGGTRHHKRASLQLAVCARTGLVPASSCVASALAPAQTIINLSLSAPGKIGLVKLVIEPHGELAHPETSQPDS